VGHWCGYPQVRNLVRCVGLACQYSNMAAKQETSKLHHYVPQSYLRGFANENERLTVTKLPGHAKPFTTIVKNVGAQTHFHRVEELDPPDKFEGLLSDIEGSAQTVIRKLERGDDFPLTETERMTFGYFIALQAVRGPDTRRTSEMVHRQMVRMEVGSGGKANVAAWAKKNLGFEPTPGQAEKLWDQVTQPGGPPITFTNIVHIHHMLETALELLAYVLARPWALVRFENRSLITCDSPVTLVPDNADDPHGGVGFRTARAITFPLTRKLGLLMADPIALIEAFDADDPHIGHVREGVQRGDADTSQVGTTALEKLFNHHTALNASEYLYYHPEDLRFVPKELHGPRLVTMSMGGGDMEFTGAPWFSPPLSEVEA